MSFLYSLTLIANFAALTVAVWLGWYVLTRNPRSLISWLTCFTLWSVGGLFFNMLLAINPPPVPDYIPGWTKLLLPFWQLDLIEESWSGWLRGWLITPAIVLWHHATTLMVSTKMNPARLTRVFAGYVVAIVAIFIQIFEPTLFYSSVSGDPLYLNTLKTTPIYLVFIFLLIAFTVVSIKNLLDTARQSHASILRKQFIILAVATLIAGLTGPVSLIAPIFAIPLPRVVHTILLGTFVVLIGYGVARYSALVEERTIRRDFIYNASATAFVIVLYMAVTWIFVRIYDLPVATYVFIVLLAITSHSLVDISRRTLDSIFYRRENRQMRESLRLLANRVGEQNLEERLSIALDSICSSVRASYGLMLCIEGGKLQQYAAYRWNGDVSSLSVEDITSDDVKHLEHGHFPAPLNEASLLIPLYGHTEQLGALILGRPVNGVSYSINDVELLLYPSDQFADALLDARREAEYLEKVSQLTKAQQTRPRMVPSQVPVNIVEDALRNLSDFAYLGDCPLGSLTLVHSRLHQEAITHLDRGKAVYGLLTEALEKLRPEASPPPSIVPREWYPYLILHGAYVEDMLNRNIMSRLYISEGTFNRTRRSAIRSVARVLGEMEATIH